MMIESLQLALHLALSNHEFACNVIMTKRSPADMAQQSFVDKYVPANVTFN